MNNKKNKEGKEITKKHIEKKYVGTVVMDFKFRGESYEAGRNGGINKYSTTSEKDYLHLISIFKIKK